ncbi:hypothetical protein Pint_24736 [Pistacia integerrima]|uniref:Uncharacterized protein n=1 Tax=Pistacia integerrima TaxID=434235 RepID=A0ACC0YEQ8_9ROSI|nr:hypothetical protein Pint_24736 [Pistacia integerrima]
MERRQRQKLVATYIIVALLVSLIGRISSLSVTVNDEECISEYVIYEGDTVSGNFVVVDHDIFWGSDHPGIDFTVTSPAGNVVHTLTGTSGDKFEFKAPRSGMYKFCFRNPYSTPETVSFYIHVGHIPNEHNLAKDVATGLANNVSLSYKKPRLRSSLQPKGMARTTSNCVTHNSPSSAKTKTNESTRKRLLGYTIGEYVLLAAASALQVAYIRSLFSKSVAYNRV